MEKGNRFKPYLHKFTTLALSCLLASVALADKSPRLVRVRGRSRQARGRFGRRLAQQPQPINPFVDARAASSSYGAAIIAEPSAPVARAEAISTSYGAAAAPSEVRQVSTLYGAPSAVEPVVERQVEAAANDYAAPSEPAPVITEVREAASSYRAAAASAPVVTQARQASTSYAQPQLVELREITPVAQPSNSYVVSAAAAPVVSSASRANSVYTVPRTAAASTRTTTTTRAKPIAIVRSTNNAPGTAGYERSFDYSFESENGIKQNAEGQMRTIGEADVMVMSGSYEYIGADGETYVVDWVADELGFRASAPHLPVAPEIPDPEHAALIEAQIRFAEEEAANERQAAASNQFESLASYGN